MSDWKVTSESDQPPQSSGEDWKITKETPAPVPGWGGYAEQLGLGAVEGTYGLAGLLSSPQASSEMFAQSPAEIGEMPPSKVPGVLSRHVFNPSQYPGPSGLPQSIVRGVGETLPWAAVPVGEAGVLYRLGMGALSAASGKIAGYFAPEKWKPAAEFFGSLFPAAGEVGARAAVKVARAGTRPFTPSGQEEAAVSQFRGAASDAGKAETALQTPPKILVPGSEPTTAQAIDDLGILGLERKTGIGKSEDFIERRAEQNKKRVEALEKISASGAPESVSSNLKSSLADIDTFSENAYNVSVENAKREAEKIGGYKTPEEYGGAMRSALAQAETAARAEEGALWKAVDPDKTLTIDARPVFNAAAKVYGRLTQAAEVSLSPAERQILGVIGGYPRRGPYPNTVPFGEITDLRSLVSGAMRQELYSSGRTPAYGRLSRLRSSIEDQISNGIVSDPDAAVRLKEASAATKERVATFSPYRKVLQRPGTTAPYTMQESLVPAKIFHPGANGFEDVQAFRNAVGDTTAMPLLEDYAASSVRQSAMRPDGTIDPAALARWQARHSEALRAFPELAQKLENAEFASDSMGRVAAIRREAIDNMQSGALGKFLGATDASEISNRVGRVLTAPDGVAQMKTLYTNIKSDPVAVEGLRKAIVDHMMQRLVSNTEAAVSGVPLIKSDQFQTFVKKTTPILNQVFTPSEVKSMQNVAADLQRANRSIVGAKLPTGSSATPQDWGAQFKSIAQKHGISMFTRVLGASVGGAAGHFLGHGTVGALTGFGAGEFINALRDAGVAKTNDILRDMLLNPSVAKAMLAKYPVKMGTPLWKNAIDAFKQASLYGGVMAGSELERQQQAKGGRVIPRKTRAREIAARYGGRI